MKSLSHEVKDISFDLMADYSIYLASYGDIRLLEIELQGPKIGLCAPYLYMYSSKVDASGMGCSSDEGVGSQETGPLCAGAGASYLSKGGYGGSYSKGNQEYCSRRNSPVVKMD